MNLGKGKGKRKNLEGGDTCNSHKLPLEEVTGNQIRSTVSYGKGKGKRKNLEGGDTCDSHKLPLEEVTGNQIRSTVSYEGAARSIYVMVSIFTTCPAYSIYKVDYPYSCSDVSPKRLHRLATLETSGGETFVSVRTQHRKWMVGVGGSKKGCRTIVFDTKTKEFIHGPDLVSGKNRPVLVSVEDKIYALSKCPRVTGKFDFEPWFEVLDLSQAKVLNGRLEECSWKELQNPPCFPCQVTAMELRYPPLVTVCSYLVVGSYILVSLRSFLDSGTYAFNTISEKWQQVDSKDLPFMGCATPHGASGVYLAMSGQDTGTSRQENPAVISAYCIKLRPASPSKNVAGISLTTFEKDNPAMKLSVTECPIKSETCKVVTGNYFSSLDKGSFCSLNWKSSKHILSRHDDISEQLRWCTDDDVMVQLPKKAYITLEIYQTENSALQETERTLPVTTQKIAISKQVKQSFKIRTKSEGFISPSFITVFNTNEPAAAVEVLQLE